MKNIIAIFLNDLNKIKKNIMAVVVIIGICVLPALYAWFNIASNWDPYSNTGNLNIAVVNSDEGAEIGSLSIQVGDKIVESLKANKQIGWVFVDKETAARGVNDGTYYASVEITPDFSRNLISVIDGEFKQSDIIYTINEKTNAIAPKITDKGAEALKTQIDSTYVSTIINYLASALNVATKTIDENKETPLKNIEDSIDNTRNDITSLRETLSLLNVTIDSMNALLTVTGSDIENLNNRLNSLSSAQLDKANIPDITGPIKEVMDMLPDTFPLINNLNDDISFYLEDAFSKSETEVDIIVNDFEKVKKLCSEVIDLNNKLMSVFEKLEKTLQIDLSHIKDLIGHNIEKYNTAVNKINAAVDAIHSLGYLPENIKNELTQFVGEAKDQFGQVRDTYNFDAKNIINNAVDNLCSTFDDVKNILNNVSNNLSSTVDTINTGKTAFDSLKSTITATINFLGEGDNKLVTLKEKIGNLRNNTAVINIIENISNDPSKLGEFMSSPVNIQTEKMYPVENYGSAMTPFYTILATWVGAIVLVSVFKANISENDRKIIERDIKPYQEFFGRYLIFFMLALFQALVISVGDIVFLKVQCVSPVLFIVTALISAFVFSLIVFSLTIALSVVGKALAVIILVLQVAGSGGTFPPELLPDFFRTLLPFLPFRYAIDAMRETVAGVLPQAYLANIGYLLIFVAAALVIGIVFRAPCIRPIKFFTEKIEDTDLIV